jgi:hypothetical protein
MPTSEKLDVKVDHFLEKGDLSEFEPMVMDEASRCIDHHWVQDVERLDEIIGHYLPIAQSADQDFDRALRAAYVMLELIEAKSHLLYSGSGANLISEARRDTVLYQ